MTLDIFKVCNQYTIELTVSVLVIEERVPKCILYMIRWVAMKKNSPHSLICQRITKNRLQNYMEQEMHYDIISISMIDMRRGGCLFSMLQRMSVLFMLICLSKKKLKIISNTKLYVPLQTQR